MKKIHKYVLTGTGKSYPASVVCPLPIGAKVVSVGNQLEKICLWAEVETTSPTENRVFQVLTTGAAIDDYNGQGSYDPTFIGTVLLKGGTAVAHVYELVPVAVPATPAE